MEFQASSSAATLSVRTGSSVACFRDEETCHSPGRGVGQIVTTTLAALSGPDRGQRELRELVRYRRTLINERADVVRRIQKVLEGANIKLGDVASDVMGVSGRAMLWSLAEGRQDPAELAQLAKTSLRRKSAELQLALEGSVSMHQQAMLRRQHRPH